MITTAIRGGMVLTKKIKWTKGLIVLLLLGLGQICYGLYASIQVSNGNLTVNMNNAIILLLFISNLLIIYGFYQKRQRQQLEGKLRETQYLMQIEQMNYQVIEERRVQVAKIRHDLNNQLATIQQLLLQDQRGYASKLMEAMEVSIQQGAGQNYCNNSLINIVLNDKQRIFFNESISFLPDVSLQEETFVDAQQLCSVFTNILQLSLQCLKGSVSAEKKVVLLTTSSLDELQIRCEIWGGVFSNAVQSVRYEEKVLQDIATKYYGTFQINDTAEKIIVELTLQKKS